MKASKSPCCSRHQSASAVLKDSSSGLMLFSVADSSMLPGGAAKASSRFASKKMALENTRILLEKILDRRWQFQQQLCDLITEQGFTSQGLAAAKPSSERRWFAATRPCGYHGQCGQTMSGPRYKTSSCQVGVTFSGARVSSGESTQTGPCQSLQFQSKRHRGRNILAKAPIWLRHLLGTLSEA